MRRKPRPSKFVGKTFDNNWTCTNINIAHATLTHKNGGPTYWYAFERPTSDGKFMKWFRVEASVATKIWKGLITVEAAHKKYGKSGLNKANYNFN